MKSRPPGPAAHCGQERERAGIDTSLQRHEPGQFESKSDPDARPPTSSLFESWQHHVDKSCPTVILSAGASDSLATVRAFMNVKRLLLLVTMAAATSLFLSVAARADTKAYWGYNNMTQTNPPAYTCQGQYAGFACSGFNNIDRTQIDYQSGDAFIDLGFQNCVGCTFKGDYIYGGNIGVWTILRSEWNSAHPTENPINSYNRSACRWGDWAPTYAYLQCRRIVLP